MIEYILSKNKCVGLQWPLCCRLTMEIPFALLPVTSRFSSELWYSLFLSFICCDWITVNWFMCTRNCFVLPLFLSITLALMPFHTPSLLGTKHHSQRTAIWFYLAELHRGVPLVAADYIQLFSSYRM